MSEAVDRADGKQLCCRVRPLLAELRPATIGLYSLSGTGRALAGGKKLPNRPAADSCCAGRPILGSLPICRQCLLAWGAACRAYPAAAAAKCVDTERGLSCDDTVRGRLPTKRCSVSQGEGAAPGRLSSPALADTVVRACGRAASRQSAVGRGVAVEHQLRWRVL